MKNLSNTILLGSALFVSVYGIGKWSEIKWAQLTLEKQKIQIEASRHVWEICEKGGIFDDGKVRCKTGEKIIYGNKIF